MKRRFEPVGWAFLLLGLAVGWASWALPSGVGRVPGPGFFPAWIGAATTLLAAALLLVGEREPATVGAASSAKPAIIAALIFAYLLAWGTGLFWLRTLLFLTVFLRLLGEAWRSSFLVSAVLTAAATGAFQYGLRVSLE